MEDWFVQPEGQRGMGLDLPSFLKGWTIVFYPHTWKILFLAFVIQNVHVLGEKCQNCRKHWYVFTMFDVNVDFFYIYNFNIFIVLLSVLRGHSVFSSPPQRPMIFYPRFYPLHLFSYLNSWESECWWHWLNLFSMFSMFVDAEKG